MRIIKKLTPHGFQKVREMDKMKPIEEMAMEEARKIRCIMFDIDDTITSGGKLTAEAYAALWALHRAGYLVVPVTGRPAGWCDMIIREWPADAVIGENGAFVYYAVSNGFEAEYHPLAEMNISAKLKEIEAACRKEVPGFRVSKDQFARRFDLAIDFNEDPPYLGLETAEKIKEICQRFGAVAKVSSIHVNTWFGNYSKVSMAKIYLSKYFQEDEMKERVLFFGDSMNDEPMFEFFIHSCAVANIKPFVPQLKSLPAFVTKQESGRGFVEAVELFLEKVNHSPYFPDEVK